MKDICIFLWCCICMQKYNDLGSCMKLQWNNWRSIMLAINIDRTLFHLAAAEMISFQTLKHKKDHSSCWVAVFVYLQYVHIRRCVWTPSNHPSFTYNTVTKARAMEMARDLCVCVTSFHTNNFSPTRCSHGEGTSTQMSQVSFQSALES